MQISTWLVNMNSTFSQLYCEEPMAGFIHFIWPIHIPLTAADVSSENVMETEGLVGNRRSYLNNNKMTWFSWRRKKQNNQVNKKKPPEQEKLIDWESISSSRDNLIGNWIHLNPKNTQQLQRNGNRNIPSVHYFL